MQGLNSKELLSSLLTAPRRNATKKGVRMLRNLPVLLFRKHFDATGNVDIKDIVNDPDIVEEAYRALRKNGLLPRRSWGAVLSREQERFVRGETLWKY